MFRLGWAPAIVLAGVLIAPSALAQDSAVKGLRIVVPDARGKKEFGKAPLTKAVRRALAESIGPLIPSKKLEQAQKKLKHKAKDLGEPAALAEAAKESDAQYVLSIEITKDKWLFTARAVLINAETGEVQMDFRSQFYKPKADAEDRGKRIGMRTVQKLEDLLKAGPAPFSGSTGAVARAGGGEKGGGEKGGGEKIDEPIRDNGGGGEDLKGEGTPAIGSKNDNTNASNGNSTVASSSGSSGNGSSSNGNSTVASNSSGSSGGSSGSSGSSGGSSFSSSGSSSSGSSGGSGTSAGVVITPEEPEPIDEFFRLTVAGGAGLLRTYDVTASGVDNSRLSYRLAPLALLQGELELVIPGVPLGVLARTSYRPVRFEVTIEGERQQMNPTGNPPEANTPSGMFLDTEALLEAPLAVAGEGRHAFRLIPGAGVRLAMVHVSRHRGDIVVSSTSFSPIGMFALRMPINDVLELNLGVDGGLVLGYSESPGETGIDPDGGICIGGDFKARIWLSSGVAIAFDTRFDFEKVSFKGAPSRMLPAGETIENASLTTKDLRTGVGIAFRL